EAEDAAVVAEPEEPVLAPAVRARRRLFVRERAPRVAVLRVVLADGAPLALAQVRAPAAPLHFGARLVESHVLGGLGGLHGGRRYTRAREHVQVRPRRRTIRSECGSSSTSPGSTACSTPFHRASTTGSSRARSR